MQQQKAQASIPPQIVLHMVPQAPPMAIMPFQPPPGPPPPPAAGAIAIPVPVPRPAPLLKPEFIVKAPMPTPAPTIQPERVIRSKTDEFIRKQQKELDEYNRARKADKPNRVAPWNSGIANPPTLPPPIAAPAVLPEAPTAPGAAVVLPTAAPPAPLPAAPVVRGRARAPRSIAAQSTRYAPTEGTREESVDTTRSRSRSVVRTARAPRVIRPKPLAKAKKETSAMSILTPQAIAVDRKPKQVSFKKPEEEEDDKPPPPRRRRITKKEPPPPAAAPKNRRAPIPDKADRKHH